MHHRGPGSTQGTLVNGVEIRGPRRLQLGDRIQVADYTLVFEAFDWFDDVTAERAVVPVEAVEAQLLADISTRDDASRLVYADWLEQRGHHARAEFLRVQQEMIGISVDDPRFRGLSARLRELADTIDVQWRRKVARPVIESCVAFDFRCPKEWGALSPTKRSNVKHCDSCNKDVFYCVDVTEARKHAARGACVAIDLASVRWRHDLSPPFGEIECSRCSADLGPGNPDACPQCGSEARSWDDMAMGQFA